MRCRSKLFFILYIFLISVRLYGNYHLNTAYFFGTNSSLCWSFFFCKLKSRILCQQTAWTFTSQLPPMSLSWTASTRSMLTVRQCWECTVRCSREAGLVSWTVWTIPCPLTSLWMTTLLALDPWNRTTG